MDQQNQTQNNQQPQPTQQTQQQNTPTQPVQTQQSTTPSAKAEKKSPIVMIGVILFIIILLVAGVALYFFSQDNGTEPANNEETQETSIDNLPADEAVDETVEDINTELENLETETDFENIDEELELGL